MLIHPDHAHIPRRASQTTWFAVGGLGLMLPGIFFYHYLDPGEEKDAPPDTVEFEASVNSNKNAKLHDEESMTRSSGLNFASY